MQDVITTPDGTRFPTQAQWLQRDETALAEFILSVPRERKLFKRMLAAVGTKSLFRNRVRTYLNSEACKFVAMVEQAKPLPEIHRQPLWVYHHWAKKLTPCGDIFEPVKFWFEEKGSGSGYRVLHSFGPMQRAAQQLVNRVLSTVWKPADFQFGIPKRGQSAAIASIKSKISEGYRHGLTLDIRDFYNSFSREKIASLLPLPEPLIANVVVPQNFKLRIKEGEKKQALKLAKNYIAKYPSSSPTVLPQGSACSNIVAAYITSLVKVALPPEAMFVMYVDDIAILAKDVANLEQARNALLLAFEKSAVGNFSFKTSESTLDSSGLSFLGHTIHCVPEVANAVVLVSEDNLNAYKKAVDRREVWIETFAKKPGPKGFLESTVMGEYLKYRLSWVYAFKEVSDFPALLNEALTRFIHLCHKHGLSPEPAMAVAGAKFPYKTVKAAKKGGGYTEKIKIGALGMLLKTLDAEPK